MGQIGIGWKIGGGTGWGNYGYQIALNLATTGRAQPVFLERPWKVEEAPADRLVTAELWQRAEPVWAKLESSGESQLALPLLSAIGNDAERAFAELTQRRRGIPNIALAFIENTCFSEAGTGRLGDYDQIVAGSTWNAGLIGAMAGIEPLSVIQGIDRAHFHPAPATRRLGKDSFVIFSGGKLEFRKGQDIVLVAFRHFQQRHPNARLVAVWGNQWSRGRSFRQQRWSPHLPPPPVDDNGVVGMAQWLEAAEAPVEHMAIFNNVAHGQLAGLMRQADVALFPNRAEGGTNLVAMEAMACGVPTILSANTGHLDIALPDCCYRLERQAPVHIDEEGFGTEGWGESDVEEVVETLETIYRSREEARLKGLAGAALMEGYGWPEQVDRLADCIGIPPAGG